MALVPSSLVRQEFFSKLGPLVGFVSLPFSDCRWCLPPILPSYCVSVEEIWALHLSPSAAASFRLRFSTLAMFFQNTRYRPPSSPNIFSSNSFGECALPYAPRALKRPPLLSLVLSG